MLPLRAFIYSSIFNVISHLQVRHPCILSFIANPSPLRGWASVLIPTILRKNNFPVGCAAFRANSFCLRILHFVSACSAGGPSGAFVLRHQDAMARPEANKRNLTMNIGRFDKTRDGFSGAIRTLSVFEFVKIVRCGKKSQNSPDFRVLLGSTEIGAAWEQKITDVRDGENTPSAEPRDCCTRFHRQLLDDKRQIRLQAKRLVGARR
jgi:hypothetical protein